MRRPLITPVAANGWAPWQMAAIGLPLDAKCLTSAITSALTAGYSGAAAAGDDQGVVKDSAGLDKARIQREAVARFFG